MRLFNTIKRYKRKLERHFNRKEGNRHQFNFSCDRNIAMAIKLMAKSLGTPIYPLCEHLLQLGSAEVVALMEDPALRERLCRHLLERHLMVPAVVPELEPVSRRAMRFKNAMNFLELLDNANNPQAQLEIIMELWNKSKEPERH
jgi:hypothetical protein